MELMISMILEILIPVMKIVTTIVIICIMDTSNNRNCNTRSSNSNIR